jgi:hypothetical protein
MPRLSLYKPERGADFKFLDRQINEMFTIGGTDLFVHKYIGTNDGTTEKDETQIQDMLFLENRDRKYDPDVYKIRGIYNVQDIDFDLSQFGLFLSNDTLFMTVHITSSVDAIGRKLMPGDVIELPHLKDEYALNDFSVALKRFYVIEDINRAAEGFSPTWYPHLYRLKLKQIVDSQEYKDILDLPASEDYPEDGTLRDVLSTFEAEMNVNNAVVAEAEANTPKSGYDVDDNYYTLAVDENTGRKKVQQVAEDGSTITDSATPTAHGYKGLLIGDEFAPNGSNFSSGISFPLDSTEGDYFLRTDFLPQRMFRYDGRRWLKVHDVKRAPMNNSTTQTLRGSFINDVDTYMYVNPIAQDFVRLNVGQTIINTEIPYITAKYIQLEYTSTGDGGVRLNYIVDDNTGMLINYTYSGTINTFKIGENITITDLDTTDWNNVANTTGVTYSVGDTITIVNVGYGAGEATSTRVKITLPSGAIKEEGLYSLSLHNERTQQRQALSQVLTPKADN